MKKFTIEIHPYPQEFIISANTKEEAEDVAIHRFYSQTNGASIYETKLLLEEEI